MPPHVAGLRKSMQQQDRRTRNRTVRIDGKAKLANCPSLRLHFRHRAKSRINLTSNERDFAVYFGVSQTHESSRLMFAGGGRWCKGRVAELQARATARRLADLQSSLPNSLEGRRAPRARCFSEVTTSEFPISSNLRSTCSLHPANQGQDATMTQIHRETRRLIDYCVLR